MTKAQKECLLWIKNHNSDGMFGKDGIFVAAGERAPFMRSTFNALCKLGICEIYNKKRLRIVIRL